jgi:cell wall-associated NlpC family hydrolase
MKEVMLFFLAAPLILLIVASARLEVMHAPDRLHAALVVPTNLPLPAAPSPTLGPVNSVDAVIAEARTWLGTPYLWGGCTRRGVDCSCFVRNAWATAGISMPRTTSEQIRWATPITRDQIQPGDLIFFNNTCSNCGPNPTHVGMSLGGNSMIHAGDPVQIARWDGMQFAGAGRVHP